MEPMYLSIQQKETGKQIKKLLMENGYTVKDVQNAMGFENPQAIFWVNKEATSSTYVAAINEEPVVPEYDYTEVVATITSLGT